MNKKEALDYIRSVKGYVPYIGIFEIYSDEDEIPQGLIDLSCKKDRSNDVPPLICSAELSDMINKINKF